MSPPLWTAQEVADHHGVTVRWVWQLARNGRIPVTRTGPTGRWMRFDPEQVKALPLGVKS